MIFIRIRKVWPPLASSVQQETISRVSLYLIQHACVSLQGKGRTSAKGKTENDSGAICFSFFLNLVTGIKVENGLIA